MRSRFRRLDIEIISRHRIVYSQFASVSSQRKMLNVSVSGSAYRYTVIWHCKVCKWKQILYTRPQALVQYLVKDNTDALGGGIRTPTLLQNLWKRFLSKIFFSSFVCWGPWVVAQARRHHWGGPVILVWTGRQTLPTGYGAHWHCGLWNGSALTVSYNNVLTTPN